MAGDSKTKTKSMSVSSAYFKIEKLINFMVHCSHLYQSVLFIPSRQQWKGVLLKPVFYHWQKHQRWVKFLKKEPESSNGWESPHFIHPPPQIFKALLTGLLQVGGWAQQIKPKSLVLWPFDSKTTHLKMCQEPLLHTFSTSNIRSLTCNYGTTLINCPVKVQIHLWLKPD